MSPEEDDVADSAFERRVRAELKGGVDELPPEIRSRLDRIVERALRAPSRPRGVWFALPAGVAAAVAIFVIAQQLRGPVAPAPSAQAAEDLGLLLNVDNLDLLEQMEFYRWLDQQPGALEDALSASSEPAQRS